jgi:hypothetical protein
VLVHPPALSVEVGVADDQPITARDQVGRDRTARLTEPDEAEAVD